MLRSAEIYQDSSAGSELLRVGGGALLPWQAPAGGERLTEEPALSQRDGTCVAFDPESLAIGESLLQSVLLEVSCYPKPGLVTPLSSGSHSDMNLQTFILSSAAIAPCFYGSAQIGRHCRDVFGNEPCGEAGEVLRQLRVLGVKYERRLLDVTNGVNTQRGILFSASILCAAAGWLSTRGRPFEYADLSRTSSSICRGLCDRDFDQLRHRPPVTAGEVLFQRYGATGIRGEAEAGFPTVIGYGLPALENALSAGLSIRLALVQTLLAIMSGCDDTTVLWRGGQDELSRLKELSQAALHAGGMLNERGRRLIDELDTYCVQRRLSPGGSADLLALTAGFYLLKNKAFSTGVM